MPSYKVVQGDHLTRIAEKYGFADFRTIWNHPQNQELKTKRQDPHVLYPGDVVFIPEKQQKAVSVATGRTHRFAVPTSKLMLRLVITDFDDQPIANTDCELEVEGKVYPLKTDGKGKIEQEIPKSAEAGKLRIPKLDLEFVVKIGHLDPQQETSGWQGRLINLGYHAGPITTAENPLMKYAIEEFQCDHSLKVTGILDDATRAKLKQMHGG